MLTRDEGAGGKSVGARRIAAGVLFVLMLSGPMGCLTGSRPGHAGRDGMNITVTPSGAILVDGKTTAPERLADRLQACGATPDTTVTVDMPEQFSSAQIKAITSRLVAAGYRKIIFKGPKRAEASAPGNLRAPSGGHDTPKGL